MKLASWPVEALSAFAKRGWRASCAASFLNGIARLVKPRGKKILSNLALVYPESTPAWRKDIRRQVYGNLAWTLTELMALRRDPSLALEWVEEVQNAHYVEDAIAEGKGVVVLSGHYGNWELMGAWYPQFFKKKGLRDLRVVVQNIKDKDINRIVTDFRLSSGSRLLPKETTSTLEMVKLLRGGEHVGIMADVSWSGGLVLPFMGHPCTNTRGPAVLSLLGSAPIIPLGIYRKAPFRHKVVVFPPLSVPEEHENADRRVKIELLTAEVNTALENIIARQPELWFWLHNRWKHE